MRYFFLKTDKMTRVSHKKTSRGIEEELVSIISKISTYRERGSEKERYFIVTYPKSIWRALDTFRKRRIESPQSLMILRQYLETL